MKSLTFAMTFIAALLTWGLWTERRENEAKGAALRAAEHKVGMTQAALAEALMQVPHVTDTVRQIVTRTKTLRDSVVLRVTDTLAVLRYVWQTDTLRARCMECAALLDTIRSRANDKERANDAFFSLLQGEITRKTKLLEYGQRFRVQADALKGFVSGDWRLGADADVRLFGRVRLMGRAEQWLVEDQGPELFGGVRVTF